MMQTGDRVGALAPYRVLDLTGELGALCPVLLAGLGAEVIRVEPPGGHASRLTPPFLPDGRTSLYWLQMNGGKRSVVVDLGERSGRAALRELAAEADFLVESEAPGRMSLLGLGYHELRSIAPQLIYTSISAFGQTGPKAGWAGSDLIGVAAGGLLNLCGDRDRAPVRPSVEQGYAQAGIQAAVGSLMALHARQLTGRGQHVDVSMQAAVENTLGNARLYYAMEGMLTHRAGGGRAFGDVGTRMIFPSRDGYVAYIRVPQTFAALAAWFEAEGVAYAFDPELWSTRALVGPQMPTRDEVAALEADIAPFFQSRATMELYEEGQRRGLMICPVSRMADLASNPQLLFRKFFTETKEPGMAAPLRRPGAPFKMSATPWRVGPAPTLGADSAASLGWARRPAGEPVAHGAPDPRGIFRGLRIADFSWVGVGPSMAQQFAWHGADVIRVESSTRPDTFRSSGPLAPDAEGLDRSAYWSNQNRDKRGMQLNLRAPGAIAVAKRLVETSDIVTESFTPGFMREIGLDYESLRTIRPDLIMVSMSMEGQGGPHESFRGFGLILQATAGITGLTGWPDRPPVGTGVAYPDWFATHCAASALLAAVDHRRRTGEGQYIDLSQLEATTYALDAALLRYLATVEETPRLGNRHPRHAPHGVFPCAGHDRWIAIAVTSDAEWLALCDVVGDRDWASDGALAAASGRLARQDALEAGLAVWARQRSADAAQAALQARRVPAHIVATTADVEHDVQLSHRGHFWRTDHPVIGPLTYDGPAYLLSETRAAPERPAPLLGEHNVAIYRDLLGYTDTEFADLVAAGVVE